MRSARIMFVLGAVLLAMSLFGCGASPEELVSRAQKYVNEGDYSAAVVTLKAALQQAPDSAQARWQLGTTYLEMEDGASAEKELRRARALGVADDSVLPLLARALVLQGKADEVLGLETPAGLSGISQGELASAQGLAHAMKGENSLAEDLTAKALKLAPGSLFAVSSRVQVLIVVDRLEEADELLGGLLQTNPNSGLAWSLAGDIASRQDELEKAEQAYTKAFEKRGNKHEDQLKRAFVLLRRGNLEGALTDATQLNNRLPKLQPAWYVRGLAHFQRKEFTAAQEALGRSFELDGTHLPTVVLLGLTNLTLGNMAQATAMAERAVAISPNMVSARLLMAEVFLKNGRPQQAEEMVRPVVRTLADNRTAKSLLARSLQAQGRGDEAAPLLEQIAAADPESLDLQIQVGIELLRAGRPDMALQLLERASDSVPDAPRPKVAAIAALVQNGKLEEALVASERLREQFPDDFLAYRTLGAVQTAMGNRSDATTSFREALNLKAGDPEVSVFLADLLAGENDLAGARQLLEGAVDRHPDDVRLMVALAELARRQGAVAEMKQLLTRAVQHDPDNLLPRVLLGHQLILEKDANGVLDLLPTQEGVDHPDVLIQRAAARRLLGQFEAERNNLERLVAVRPDSAEAYFLLARAYGSLGDNPRAINALKKASSLAPGNVKIGTALARLMADEGQLEQASALVTSLGLADSDPAAISIRAYMAQRGGDIQAWLLESHALFEAAPSSRTLLRLTAAQVAASQLDQAEQDLKAWLAVHPGDDRIVLALAGLFARAGQPDQVVATLRPLAVQYPDNTVVLNNLAWSLKDNDPAEALIFAERAYKLAPSDPAIVDTYVWLLETQRQTEQALRVLAKAIESSPEPLAFERMRARILQRTK